MSQSAEDLFELFDTSVVSDALDRHDGGGVINGLPPAHHEHAAVGRAHTLRLEEVEVKNADGSDTNFPYALLHELAADRVLVLDGADPGISCWGGNASRLAENAGVNGIVVDGGYRDVPEVRAGSFPVFGRAPTPKTGQRRLSVEAIGEPVEIGGVTVAPDDLIVADATGIVVVPADSVSDVAETAEGILREELLVEKKIEAGATVPDLESDEHDF